METLLKCSNPECVSHGSEDDVPCFVISVSVGADRSITDNLRRVDAEDFRCVYCSDPAVSTEEDDPPATPGGLTEEKAREALSLELAISMDPPGLRVVGVGWANEDAEVKCAHCDEPVWYDDDDGWCHENGEHDCFLAIGKERP